MLRMISRSRRADVRRKAIATRSTGIAPLRGLLPLIVLLLAWQIVGSADALTFPPPSRWFDALQAMWEGGELAPALARSLQTLVISSVLAVVVGVGLGAVIGGFRSIDRALTPILDFFRTLPPPAIVPAVALIVGPTVTSAILLVVIAAMWPVLLNSAAGMRSVPMVRTEMARCLGLTRRDRITKIILPSLTPTVLVGLRVCVPIALTVTLFVETLGVTDGVGLLLRERQQTFDSAGVWGLLLIVGIGGYIISMLVTAGGSWLQRSWPPGARR